MVRSKHLGLEVGVIGALPTGKEVTFDVHDVDI